MGSVLIATLKKGWITYKRNGPFIHIFARAVMAMLMILVPYLTFKLIFLSTLSSKFLNNAGTNDYLTYIVLGTFFYILLIATNSEVNQYFVMELFHGTLESVLITPGSKLSHLLGMLALSSITSIVQLAVVILFGLLLGAKLGLGSLIVFLKVLPFIYLSLFSMAVAMSALILYTRDYYFTENTLNYVMSLLCGFMFPIEYLPLPLQYISKIIPVTHALKLFRHTILMNESLIANLNTLTILLMLTVIYFIAGLKLLDAASKKAISSGFS